MPPRLRPSIPISLAAGSLALASCATPPAPAPVIVPIPVPLEVAQATSPCIRGRLPDDDGLTVGAVMAFGTERHRDALCERAWGEGLAAAVRAHNEAADKASRERQPKR